MSTIQASPLLGLDPLPDLRPYQRAAVEAVRSRFRDATSTYIELPTGSGKTRVLAEVAAGFAQKGKRVLAVAHREVLVRQLMSGIRADGLIMAADVMPGQITAASVQTLASWGRMGRLADFLARERFEVLLIDEAHHVAPGNGYAALIEDLRTAVPGLFVLGVTATPFRADGEEIDDVLGRPCFVRSILDLQHEGVLAPLRWRMAELAELPLRKIPLRGGDYAAEELSEAMIEATAELGAWLAPHLATRRTIAAFAVSIEHAHTLALEMSRRGIPSAYVHGSMGRLEREAIIDRWRRGELRLVANVGILTEGFDLPQIDAVVIGRPTHSQGLYLQMVGRGTRLAPGKADCLVVDSGGSGELADPAQVILPEVSGIRTAEELEEEAGQEDASRARDLIERVVTGAKRRERNHWLWRSLPPNTVRRIGGVILHAPFGPSQEAVLIPAGQTGLHWAMAIDTKTSTITWEADQPLTARKAALHIARSLSEQEVKHLSRAAPWRSQPPSEGQLRALRYSRHQPATKGEASDMMSDLFTTRALVNLERKGELP